MRTWLGVLLCVVACKDDPTEPVDEVMAIHDSSRAEHFFDWPFPSDDMRDADGRPDLSAFPIPEVDPARGLVEGWVHRCEVATTGWGNNTSAYFRFDGAVSFPEQTPGGAGDPVVWVSMDGSQQLPLLLNFVADPLDDPFFGPNTLAITPDLGSPVSSGGTYVAAVMRSAGVAPPVGYVPDPVVVEALSAAGISGEVAVATVFTVQDPVAELEALRDDVLPRLSFADAGLRRVVQLEYQQDLTPSGNEATRATVTFEDGATADTWMGPEEGAPHSVYDLLDWPMAIYEGHIQTWNYQGLADRPYMSPGFAHIADTELYTGWIDVDATGVHRTPEPEQMRIVVGLPLDDAGQVVPADGVVMHDHGTGGHAYSIVQRASASDDGRGINQVFADHSMAFVGRDAALYGTRYPLIDEGHGASLGFYNIVNPPAFRDNQRQTAVDGRVLRAWIADEMSLQLPEGSVDGSNVMRTGHSLGSVTSNLGYAMDPGAWERGLLTGTGGIFTHYFLDTGLLEDLTGGDLMDALFLLVGGEVPDPITSRAVLSAILGLSQDTAEHMDRQHPALMLFQWQMDPSDPMAVARAEHLPLTALISPGDFQTPDFTADALVEVLPQGSSMTCAQSEDYDPHYCYWREPDGKAALQALVSP